METVWLSDLTKEGLSCTGCFHVVILKLDIYTDLITIPVHTYTHSQQLSLLYK